MREETVRWKWKFQRKLEKFETMECSWLFLCSFISIRPRSTIKGHLHHNHRSIKDALIASDEICLCSPSNSLDTIGLSFVVMLLEMHSLLSEISLSMIFLLLYFHGQVNSRVMWILALIVHKNIDVVEYFPSNKIHIRFFLFVQLFFFLLRLNLQWYVEWYDHWYSVDLTIGPYLTDYSVLFVRLVSKMKQWKRRQWEKSFV